MRRFEDDYQNNNIKQNESKQLIRREEESLIDLHSSKLQLVLGVQESGKETLCINALERANVKYVDLDVENPIIIDLLNYHLNKDEDDYRNCLHKRTKLTSDYNSDDDIYENVSADLKNVLFDKLNGTLNCCLNGKVNDIAENTSNSHLEGKIKRIFYNNARNDRNNNDNLSEISKSEDLNIFLENVLIILYEFYEDYEYIFIKEIQKIRGWHKLVIKLLQEKKHVIATSSNANLFDGDFIPYLIGRINVIHLYPISFKEFCTVNKLNVDNNYKSQLESVQERIQEKMLGSVQEKAIKAEIVAIKERMNEEMERRKKILKIYIKQGGFPALNVISQKSGSTNSLTRLNVNYPEKRKKLIHKILRSEDFESFHVKNKVVIKNLMNYLSNCVPCLMNTQDIRDKCKIKSNTTVRHYISILEQIYFVIAIPKYTPVRPKRKTKKKIYLVDTLLMNYNDKLSSCKNYNRMVETVVLIEILRQTIPKGYEVYYYSDRSSKCDFLICKDRKAILAIQNCYFIKENSHKDLIKIGRKLKCKNLLILNNYLTADYFKVSMYNVLYYRSLNTLNLSEWLI